MISVHQIQLYRWWEQGIQDTDDLAWLMEFYRQSYRWNHNLILSAIQEARLYYREHPDHEICTTCTRPLP